MQLILKIIKEIINVYIDMAPYLFLGLTIAGVLHIFFDRNFVAKHLGKSNLWSVIKASLLGVPIPLCSCGVIPTAMSLRKNNASKGATISFLVSTPQTGVDSIAATYGMLGPIFAIFRPIIAFITGVIAGVMVNIFEPKATTTNNWHQVSDSKVQPCCEANSDACCTDTPTQAQCCTETETQSTCCETNTQSQAISLLDKTKKMLHFAYFEFLDDISINLTIGIIIAGIISAIIPENFFSQHFFNESINMILMIIAGIPLYICATASIPVAATLIMKGISPGAAFVFLAVGPATNAATITVLAKQLGKRTLLIYLSVISIGAVIAGYLLNAIFSITGQTALHTMTHNHQGAGSLTLSIVTILFTIFLALSLFRSIKR